MTDKTAPPALPDIPGCTTIQWHLAEHGLFVGGYDDPATGHLASVITAIDYARNVDRLAELVANKAGVAEIAISRRRAAALTTD